MSTVFDVRNLRLPERSRKAVIIGSLLLALALVAAFGGVQLFRKLNSNTVVAYFPQTDALYPGDAVQIMGVRVGAIDKIEPAGDKMKVTLHYNNKYKVPAEAKAIILNPTLVASRTIQLEPPYRGGAVLANNAVIPEDRTEVPVEWDTLRNDVTNIINKLGPTAEQPTGPIGEVIESFADGLAGKGQEINTAFDNLSEALTALNKGRGDFFAVVRSLSLFVKALDHNDQQFVTLNRDLAKFTSNLNSTDQALATATDQFYATMTIIKAFLSQNAKPLVQTINNVAETTTAITQPDALDGFETALHILPNVLSAVGEIYHPAQGMVLGSPVLVNFANPMEFICSAIQAGSRLGYQDSAELCAEYLAPVADAIKFNYLPFGINIWTSAYTLPKQIAYSEPRLQPPPGYKDTTVPGIWVPDTPFSHRNTQPGWITAPGMQGVEPGHDTARLLTPESLAQLMGGPDPAPVDSQYQTPPGPPNSYDEAPGPLPFIGQPPGVGPIAPPPPGPNVIPGPVAPLPPRGQG
ncbi:MCE family protein [Mycolicibacter hiberniae]|uniref:Mce family protein Mce1D n=1 Tax=Mycolicibacter hiberniae TaxID=29314 RepID=A0A7I7X9E7_9MYCO|nr:MCE family protein [Mycolicibacter hiberniae]MCV7087522.1 MCE family protein [Mycolicibacter hiberniae]ORV69087.1 mammalian cell entry protein [Mycolicibacter hiberniae]BBZ24958.1 Mce family protein Mce1D [Mycolicibacter hiberniae]